MFRVLVVLLVSLSVMGLDGIGNNNFGPYDLRWKIFKTCKGPKKTDCGLFKIENYSENMSDVVFSLDFPKDCLVTRARITTWSTVSNTTRNLFNYGMQSPCQHFVLGPILKEAFNITNKCMVNKGKYSIHVNLYQRSKDLLGSKFFYGTFTYKMYVHNNVDNFFCVDSQINCLRVKNK